MPVKTKSKSKSTKSKKSSKKAKLTSKGFFKRPSRARLFMFVVMFATIGVATALLSKAATGDGSVPVYRLVQSQSGEHLLTASKAEVDSLVPKTGFSNEGVGFSAWLAAGDGRVPAYRLYPKAGGKHLITTSEVEKAALVNGGAWSLEGTAFYVYPTAGSGHIPVYRLANAAGDHLLTTSTFEKDQLVANKSYGLEGIAFYVSGSVPAQNVHQPGGSIDASGCGTVVGWVLDGDNLSTAEPVHIYIDNFGYNTGATNISRPDVNKVYSSTGNHGYNFAIPDKWKDGKLHKADVYAININSEGKVDGNNVLIGTKQFACNAYGQDISAQLIAQQQAAAAAAAAKAQQQAAYIAAANAAKQLQANPTLQLGSSGPAVSAFQQRLANRGFWLAADGVYGSTTEYSVRAFSIEIGLGNRGTVDASTYQAMSEAEANNWRFNPNDPILSVIQPPAPPVVVARLPLPPPPVSACGPAFTVAQCEAFGVFISQPPAVPSTPQDPTANCLGWSRNSNGTWNNDFGVNETKSRCINEQYTANGANSQHIDWNGSEVWTRPAPVSNGREDPAGSCKYYGLDVESGSVTVWLEQQIRKGDCFSNAVSAGMTYYKVTWNDKEIFPNTQQ